MECEQLLRTAYEAGYTDDPDNLPECVGTVDPETNQIYNCDQCPLKDYCLEWFKEVNK